MRPIQLTMSAFGPYRGQVELDFTSFGASSIFLVTGPTGAGKTTIFDALTYALFNYASGESRDIDMLKSQFATDEDLCFVDLTFEVGTEQYRVKRIPTQRGPGTRQKTRNYTANVEFYKEDQLIGTGREANQAITELLGLSFEQFRQIVMLPQGEFRRLLQSNSSDKETIFRNIFGTERIQDFQETLKDNRKDLRKQFESYQTRLDQSLSTIVAPKDSELAEAIEQADYEKVLEVLGGFISQGNKELTEKRQALKELGRNEKENDAYIELLKEEATLVKAKKELDAAEKEIEALQEALRLHEQAVEVEKAEVAYEKLATELKQTEADLEKNQVADKEIKVEIKDLTAEDEKAKEAEKQLDGIRKEVTDLEAEQKKFAELEKKSSARKEKNSDLKAVRETIQGLKQAGEQFASEVKDLTADIQKIQVWREEYAEEQKEQAALKEKHAAAKGKKETVEKIIKLQGELAGLLKDDAAASKAYEKAQKAYEEARQHYFGNLAGVLVGELEEEEPCPVCGSVHHPSPATISAEGVTEEDLAEVEVKRDDMKAEHTEIATAVKHKGAQIKEEEELLGAVEREYEVVLTSVSEKEAELATKLSASEKTLKDLEEKLTQETAWREALAAAQTASQENQLKETQAKSKEENILEQIETLEAEIKAIDEELEFASQKEIQTAITERTNKIKSIQEEAAAVRQQLTEKTKKQAQIETSISMLTEQLDKNTKATNEQKEVLAALLDKYDFDEDFSKYVLKENQEEEYKATIERFKEEKSYNTRQLKQVTERLEKQEDTRTVSEVAADLEKIREEKEQLEDERDALIAQNSQHTSSFNEIKKNYTESQKIHKPLAIYEELTEIANGSKETNYVSFERYVLGIYFNEVLFAANKRFETMTNGRYEMVRRESRTKGASPDGLEIDVFDRYAGATRSVKTLSGGETFKASLALALGLSDVIQSEQGGVHVETLFIDEGFGTLDADSLEMAIETLMDLQATGRLIGVISHVEALKDRIPARIVVENKQEGSHARIEVE